MIFSVSRKNCEFAKTLKKHWFLQCFVKVDLAKNNNKSAKNQWKIYVNFEWKKKGHKVAWKVDLGGSWAQFGRVWARSGQAFGHFWAHFACLFGVQIDIFLKYWSKMTSKRPFGWILGCFWQVLGRFWEAFGKVFEGFRAFWRIGGQILDIFD